MATIREVHCKSKKCGHKRPVGPLLDFLLNVANDRKETCHKCNGPVRTYLKFDFGLDGSDSACDLLDCFHPNPLESWIDQKGNRVTFYPFLVILERHNRKQAAWLPYWHIVEDVKGKRKTKYGQWAPFMDLSLFQDLLKQAQAKGYLGKFR